MKHQMTLEEYIEERRQRYSSKFWDADMALELLWNALKVHQDIGHDCPEVLLGGLPEKVLFDIDSEMVRLENQLRSSKNGGDEYEMSDEGWEFLQECLEKYNQKYATYGETLYDVGVLVPEEWKY